VERPSERHLEVLRAALELIAERGYAGASLRELARRLGVQQPSLYHYFETKEQLVEQIIIHVGAELLAAPAELPLPDRLEDVPSFAIGGVMFVWDQPLYASFVRFLFVVSVEQAQFRSAMQALYSRGAETVAAAFLEPFIERGEIGREEGFAMIRTAINSIALMMIEERLLYGRKTTSDALRTHAMHTERLLRAALIKRPSGV
jgi:AcrR family transcriptional regulator